MKTWMRLSWPLALLGVVAACAPVSVTRIGPPMPQRAKGCEVDVLPSGERPDQIHKDVGVVHLRNCQEYTVGLCRKLLIDRACQLGGHVAYLPDPAPPKSEFDAVNFRITVAVYVGGTLAPAGSDTCEAPAPDQRAPEMERCMD